MNRPSPIVQAIMLSIGATATSYRIFQNFGIALAVGCGMGVLAAAALMADQRRRDEERWYLEEERKRKEQQSQAEKPAE